MDAYLAHFQRLDAYNCWANRALVSALEAAFVQPAADYLSHILAAERTWLLRLQNQTPALELFAQGETLAQLTQTLRETEDLWREYFTTLSPEKLQAPCQYRNTKGQSFETAVNDILTHVFNHSTYHRAQAAAAMRQAGVKPAVTDFIAFARL